jgi:hypothetical protein
VLGKYAKGRSCKEQGRPFLAHCIEDQGNKFGIFSVASFHFTSLLLQQNQFSIMYLVCMALDYLFGYTPSQHCARIKISTALSDAVSDFFSIKQQKSGA